MISGDYTISNIVAGAFSGAVATGVTAPIELVKTIRQSNVAPASMTSANILTERLKTDGPKAMFRGLTPSLMAIAPHNGMFFSLYKVVKQEMTERKFSTYASSISASIVAGSAANIITNPLWVVKTRMSNQPSKYRKFVQSSREIWQAEGSRAFLSGMGLSILSVGHVVIQFPLYEYLKTQFDDSQGIASIFVSSCVSKVVACGVTYPLEVVRTQLQHYGETGPYAVLRRCRSILQVQGYTGFYGGFGASIAKAVPTTFITLWLVEHLSKRLDNFDFYISFDN